MLALLALCQIKAVLDTQRVAARRDVERAGQTVATVSVSDARERGVTSMAGLLGLAPFVQLRSARGESTPTLRAARREQVVVTLDGVALNDPATGIADIAELPLVLVDRLVVRPGAAPVQQGSGAIGGTVELSTAVTPAAALNLGAYGQRSLEGLWSTASVRNRAFVAVSHRTARNDFAFVNAAGAEPARERRINNDERRSTVASGWGTPRKQFLLVASHGERGMVGATNVRAYDEDRASTERLLLRLNVPRGSTIVRTSIRYFGLAYRDPQQPVRDTRSRVHAADADWLGHAAGGIWQLGASADALQGTGGVRQQRTRGFAGWSRQQALPSRIALDLGGRIEVVQGGRGMPTGQLGIAVPVARDSLALQWSLQARVSQAMRVPTLYDLYFSSPQRVAVRALRPERVTLDATVGARVERSHASMRWNGELTLVHRRTTDAIIWFPGNFGWSPANVGRETLLGVEARAEMERARWSIASWATAYDALLHTGGLAIPTPYVARLNGAILAQWRPARAWRGSAQWRLQARRPFTAGPRNPAFELPAVQLIDLAASRRMTFARTAWLLALSLDNAMNVSWQSVRGFPMPGRTWSVSTSWPAR